MVSVHLELSDEDYQQLLAEADQLGVDIDSYLQQRLQPSSYGSLLNSMLDTESGEDDPLGAIQDAYHSALAIMHEDMIAIQTELLELQRHIVQRTLETVRDIGLTADHHFYIAFRTDAPGVQLGDDLKAGHPETMTIVLEKQFSQVEVDDEGFSVSLWFGGVPRRLGIPFDAILAFFDPSSQLQLTFPDLASQQATAAPPADDAPATPVAVPALRESADDPGPSSAPLGEDADDADEAEDDGGGDDDTVENGDASPDDDASPADETTDAADSERDATDNVISFDAFRKK